MPVDYLALTTGAVFGSALFLGGLAEPDKIVGALRLKDFHALRTIAVFVLVGMLGTFLLSQAGAAHLSVKPTTLVTVLLGGALLGIGFGLTGYCPGTGLACAAAGRFDALVSVLGMFCGALAYILMYPAVAAPLEKIGDYGKKTLPEVTNSSSAVWVAGFVILGTLILALTARPKKGGLSADDAPGA